MGPLTCLISRTMTIYAHCPIKGKGPFTPMILHQGKMVHVKERALLIHFLNTVAVNVSDLS